MIVRVRKSAAWWCAILVLLSAITVLSFAVSCSKDKPTASNCGSCGSGYVYWDSNVQRCRDSHTGRFVNSCCCGR